MFLLDGRTIRHTNNTNVSYFNHPGFNRRIAAAAALAAPAWFQAFARIDREVITTAAPVAVYGVPNDRVYVSSRTGCYHHQPVYGLDLPALCLRR